MSSKKWVLVFLVGTANLAIADDGIPEKFHGVWEINSQNCGRQSDSYTSINKNSISGIDSNCELKKVIFSNDSAFYAAFSCKGKTGETEEKIGLKFLEKGKININNKPVNLCDSNRSNNKLSAKLFKSYAFDAPLTIFSDSMGYYDCLEEFGVTARCLDNVEFLEHIFTAAFKFDAGRLVSVSLIAEFDENLYHKIFGALSQTFSLCALQGATERLDLIELATTAKDNADFGSKTDEFESLNLNNGNLTYFFVERPVTELFTKKNTFNAILSVPAGTRVAEMSVVEKNNPDAALVVNFTLPKLALQKIKKTMEQPVEKF